MIDPTLPPHDWLRRFLEVHTGNLGSERSDAAIDTRLRSLITGRQLGDAAGLVQALRAVSGDRVRQASDPLVVDVLAALLNNETSFFRDPHCFDGLRDHVLPELMKSRRTTRKLTIWSAACSAGQEPYSLAMLLQDDLADELRRVRVDILATDASASMIERVRQGRYSTLELGRGISDERRERWFTPDSSQWQIDARLRAMVQPQVLNLTAKWPPRPRIDLVLLRNVMIYMSPETRQTILGQLREVMAPDGALVLGGPESLLSTEHFTRQTHGRLRVYRPN